MGTQTRQKPRTVSSGVSQRRVVICLLGLLCGEFAATEPEAAQGTAIIRGEVIQMDGTTRAPGVVVVAVDTAGAEVTRADCTIP